MIRGLPIGLRWEVPESERGRLHVLFIAFGDESALQAQVVDPQTFHVAVESIKVRLTNALSELDPDAAAVPGLEFLRRSCHEYLGATSERKDRQKVAQFLAAFCMVAEFIGREYRLRVATRLAGAIEVSALRKRK
ncbi:MAG TPA: hypothetical protein VGI76_08900 [Solirubrobacteraceae bacterium]|jgi:hypothetical protein